MKKIIVIGSPGAGKSVFSQKLRDVTNLPLYHIDMLYHKKGGTHISKEELEEKFKNIFREESWIVDGNYQRTLELRLKECDTVFLLDFPTDVCIAGAESRIGRKRDDLPWTEEKLDEKFKQSIIDFSKIKLPQIYTLLDKYKSNKDIVIFKSREEADNYIKEIKMKNYNKYSNIIEKDTKTLLANINKIHTTEMGINRIKKNLKLDTNDVVEYCKNKVLDKKCNIYLKGKNYYCEIDKIIITINSYSYTIITAHIKNN